MSEQSPLRDAFEARWKTLGYDERPAHSAPSETMRADLERTLAAPEAPIAQRAPLPRLSLADRASAAESDLVVLQRLGEGGMGAVDLAEQRSLGREVAIKRSKDMDAPHAAHVEALLREARVMGRLEHPGIVPVHALGVDRAGGPIIVMKRVDGHSWAALIADPAHPHWDKVRQPEQEPIDAHLAILTSLCNTLRFAHARGIIHRDIKPENVMLGAFGEVYLLDWGVALDRAQLTLESRTQIQIVGTPSFMAPEQFGAALDAHDERTDVYLLGATLHNALTATPRHAGETLHAVMLSSYLSDPVTYDPGTVPAELAQLCNEATARDPASRPQSVEQLQQRLARFALHRGSVALARSAKRALDDALAPENNAENAQQSQRARRALAEAHFGFTQALGEWSDNVLARDGLRACVLAMIERELNQRNLDGARALAAELTPVPAEVSDKIASLERSLSEERSQAERSRQREREMDRSVSAHARAALALGGFLALLGLSYALTGGAATHAQSDPRAMLVAIVRLDLAILAIYAVTVTLARRRLLQNTISRQLTAVLGVMLCAGLASDLLSYTQRAAIETCATHKFIAGAFSLVGASLAIDRALLVPAAISITAAFAMALLPALLLPISNGATLLVVLTLLWLALRTAPSR